MKRFTTFPFDPLEVAGGGLDFFQAAALAGRVRQKKLFSGSRNTFAVLYFAPTVDGQGLLAKLQGAAEDTPYALYALPPVGVYEIPGSEPGTIPPAPSVLQLGAIPSFDMYELYLQGVPTAGDTVQIGGETYTFVAAVVAPGDVLIDNVDGSLFNLAAAVMDDAGHGGVYSSIGANNEYRATATGSVLVIQSFRRQAGWSTPPAVNFDVLTDEWLQLTTGDDDVDPLAAWFVDTDLFYDGFDPQFKGTLLTSGALGDGQFLRMDYGTEYLLTLSTSATFVLSDLSVLYLPMWVNPIVGPV